MAFCCAKRWSSIDVGIKFLLCVRRSRWSVLLSQLDLPIADGLAKSVRSEKCMFFKWRTQSAKLLEVLKQKPARLPADNMKGDVAFVDPSEFNWSEAKLSGYGRNGCAGIGVIAR